MILTMDMMTWIYKVPTGNRIGKGKGIKMKSNQGNQGAIRGIELVIPFHNALNIAQLELVVAVELLDDFAILVPVVGSAGPENGRWLTDGRRLRGEGHGRWWRVRVHDELTLLNY